MAGIVRVGLKFQFLWYVRRIGDASFVVVVRGVHEVSCTYIYIACFS